MRSRRARLALRQLNTPEWHAAMGAAPDPNSAFGKAGLRTWDQVHERMRALTLRWEGLPELVRVGYAFPNPEDR